MYCHDFETRFDKQYSEIGGWKQNVQPKIDVCIRECMEVHFNCISNLMNETIQLVCGQAPPIGPQRHQQSRAVYGVDLMLSTSSEQRKNGFLKSLQQCPCSDNKRHSAAVARVQLYP